MSDEDPQSSAPAQAKKSWLNKKQFAILMIAFVVVGLALVVTVVVTKQKQQEQSRRRMQMSTAVDSGGAMFTKVKAVYTVKDIAKGQTVSVEALEERPVEQSEIPQDAVTSSSVAAGHVAKHAISAGQLVTEHDLGAQGSTIKNEPPAK